MTVKGVKELKVYIEKMKRVINVCCSAFRRGVSLGLVLGALSSFAAEQPNILFIYADDLGYGDVGCYNSESKVPTPNLDRMAAEGMRFTDAHSPATVCTPSRYGVMTGRMPFRTGMKGVFLGVDGPCLIEAERLTLPEMLRQRGYTTALFGKWHIGMTFQTADGTPVYKAKLPPKKDKSDRAGIRRVRLVDFSKRITDGPVDQGFDQFYGTVCCPTHDWLYAFVENDRVPVPPSMTQIRDRDALPKHPYSVCRPGMVAPNFDFEEIDMIFLQKSQAFLREHVKNQPNKPFFLFHSTQAVHLPSFPGRDFKGKTEAGPHGDFIFEFDYIVGELEKTLKELGVADNTLIIVSSDNGPEVATVFHMRKDHNHDGARPLRGVKRDQWEGGHRVPFIAKWPGKIAPDSICNQTICQTDIMATCAAIIGFDLPDNAAEDSFNLLPLLLGNDDQIRPYTLHQTPKLELAIRRGDWKYLDHKGSGGNKYPKRGLTDPVTELAPDAPGQLYNIADDLGETKNLYHQHPEIVKELKALLEETKKNGRSRP